jgi:hypothetical protein
MYCKKIISFVVLSFISVTSFSQKGNTSVSFKGLDFSELHDPKSFNKTAWNNLPANVMISFASDDIRYEKNTPPSVPVVLTQWKITAWKGEKVHTQILIWSSKLLNKVHIKPGRLKSDAGNEISASNVSAGFVRYVLTDGLNKQGSGCGIAPANESDSSLSADGIDLIPSKKIDAYTTQPVWLSIAVPQNAAAGKYTGKLQVIVDGKSQLLDYVVNVKPYTLPKPKDWQFHLDLWQNPYSVARVHHVKPWSQQHFDAMKPYMQMLANAGQKTITVSMIYDPWRGQTYDIYTSMIKWIKKKDGTWAYDYNYFDKWVSYMMLLGIDKLINCYTMVPWNNKFYYYDEALEKDTLLIAKSGTPEYAAHWRPMLTDFVKHLKQKGWYNKTAIAMDERPLEDMQKVIAFVRSVDKDFKISLAGSYHAEIEKDIYDYCVASAEHFDPALMDKRIMNGQPTTYYTSCVEGYPNTFTFSPPAEAAWLGWYAANKNYNGYLRWAYNSWPQKPLQDSRYSSWSAGDTYFVYPGAGSSIRFERLIEGIQDYEKIRILKAAFIKNNQHDKLQKLEVAVKAFNMEALRKYSAADMLLKAKAVLNSF